MPVEITCMYNNCTLKELPINGERAGISAGSDTMAGVVHALEAFNCQARN
ncbi:hypothetical protein [Microcoleus sp. FACHB-672]|nr:hypothetical protein [Microcoleus sp. FACHB-672]MBD2042787.1 hypothetical protein [Microcoleus sp. FACHB-672]